MTEFTEEMKKGLMDEINKVHIYIQQINANLSDQNMMCINSCNVSLTKLVDIINGKTDNKEKK